MRYDYPATSIWAAHELDHESVTTSPRIVSSLKVRLANSAVGTIGKRELHLALTVSCRK